MFESFDALLLARLQFAFTVSFHFIFPAFSIGLASFLMVLEALWLKTGKGVYANLYRYWLKIFAITFAMGVVSGIVMSYQFGTNWSVFSDRAGPVIGPLMAYEVLTAFFLEAGFLGVMLFGINKVGARLHFAATCMVALGTFISAFWILSVNSWMQTPTGFEMGANGQFMPGPSWWEIIFNPSFPYRLVHMVTAAYLATALVVAGTAGWHLLRGRDNRQVRLMLSMAMGMILVAAPLQAVVGDMHGLNTLEHQPAKLAAIEGHWENKEGEGVPLILFGIPDMEAETTRYALEIPNLGSLLLTRSWDGQVPALKDFPKADRPNSLVVFWTFRLMVGLGVLMILLAVIGTWLHRGGRIFANRPFLKFAVAMGPAGLVAILAGWFTTEVGRQPWVIYGVMRTAEGVSAHDAGQVGFTLALFVVVYLAVFGAGTIYLLRILGKGPEIGEARDAPQGGPGQQRTPMRPLSAANEEG